MERRSANLLPGATGSGPRRFGFGAGSASPLALLLLLLSLCLSLLPACPAAASSLLVSRGGFVMKTPLELQGRDVNAALESLTSTVQQQAELIEQLQATIAALTTRVDAILTPTQVHAYPQSATAAMVYWGFTSTVVTAEPGGATCNAPVDTQYCLFDELSEGQNYTFTVRPSNAAGPGPVSRPSNSVELKKCIPLTLTETSGWGHVVLYPWKSPLCPHLHYYIGETVRLEARPGPLRVEWDTSANVRDEVPRFGLDGMIHSFPATPVTLTVSYAACNPLSFGGTVGGPYADGRGSTAVQPERSLGCPNSQTYVAGEALSVQATPQLGHTFVDWTGFGSGNGTLLSFAMPAATVTLKPVFAPCRALLLDCMPADGGFLSHNLTHSLGCPAGSYVPGAPLSVSAVAAHAGYVFVSWTDGAGTVAAATPVYELPAGMPNAPLTLTARFAAF